MKYHVSSGAQSAPRHRLMEPCYRIRQNGIMDQNFCHPQFRLADFLSIPTFTSKIRHIVSISRLDIEFLTEGMPGHPPVKHS